MFFVLGKMSFTSPLVLLIAVDCLVVYEVGVVPVSNSHYNHVYINQ